MGIRGEGWDKGIKIFPNHPSAIEGEILQIKLADQINSSKQNGKHELIRKLYQPPLKD